MKFRGYMAGDFEAMFHLDELCFEQPFRFSRAMMKKFAEAKKARAVIAEDKALAGFCVVHVERVEDGCVGYVVTLDVAVEWRRKGLAGELMRRVEEEVRADGCEAMVLHVAVGNFAAVRFYEDVGYERMDRAEAFYGEGGDGWIYRKRLGSQSGSGSLNT